MQSRVWNCPDFCLYCEYEGNNLSRHLGNAHTDMKEIQEILKAEQERKGDKDMKQFVSNAIHKLVRRRNHQHNFKVQEEGKGVLTLAHRPDSFKIDEYGPCPICYSWMKLTAIEKHIQSKMCCALSEIEGPPNMNFKMRAKLLKGDIPRGYNTASPLLKSEVLDKMQPGPVKMAVLLDRLILYFGEEWMSKNSRNKL